MHYTLSQIAELCDGRLVGCDTTIESVSTDSRHFAADASTLFVAMQGVNHDAHDYIESMYERGVRAFLVEREVELSEGCGAVVVNSALEALQRLAAQRRTEYRGTVVAITGSNGKTTVKEWIAQTAPRNVKIYRSPRSYNSQLGVALSLLMLDDKADVALIEAGISQCGEMCRLYDMIRPDTVIFTSIGDAHQEGFESLEQKIDQKLELAKTAANIIYDGEERTLGSIIEKRYDNRNLIDSSAFCYFNFADQASRHNASLVAALFDLLGYEAPDFSSVQPIAMRLEVKQGIHNSVIIDDSYSADLDSLSIALDALRSVASARKRMVILTDILQSGMRSEELYGRVADLVTQAGIEHFVGIGEAIASQSALFGTRCTFYHTVEECLSDLNSLDINGYAILIKGNRQSRMERISHRLEMQNHTTVLEVNLNAVERNINYFRQHMQHSTRLVAMVKASGYGAGEIELAQRLEKQGVAYLAVAFADEGVVLRQGGITMPIVVLNADDASFETMIAQQLEPEIYSLRSLESFVHAVERAGESHYPIHLKLDSGMHRLGFDEQQIDTLCDMLNRHSDKVRVASIFTHLCAADDTSQDEFTRQQIALFDRMSSRISDHLPYRPLRHAAASAAILRFPEAHFDMCRLGLGMYGFGYCHNDALEPVSTLHTRIVQIRTLDIGQTVGYGRKGVITRPSRIATIPVGYADGLNRHLGNGQWSVMVAGKRAPIIGNICMDSCMIDITNIEGVQEGDRATIFSAERDHSVEKMADILGTIPYEVLTSISKRVKRIYIEE